MYQWSVQGGELQEFGTLLRCTVRSRENVAAKCLQPYSCAAANCLPPYSSDSGDAVRDKLRREKANPHHLLRNNRRVCSLLTLLRLVPLLASTFCSHLLHALTTLYPAMLSIGRVSISFICHSCTHMLQRARKGGETGSVQQRLRQPEYRSCTVPIDQAYYLHASTSSAL